MIYALRGAVARCALAAGSAHDRRRRHRGVRAAVVSFDLIWPVQLAAFTLLGFGFYTLHASIQVQATELSPDGARRRDVAALVLLLRGPRERARCSMALGFVTLGSAVTISIAAVIVMAVGFICARLLRERPVSADV